MKEIYEKLELANREIIIGSGKKYTFEMKQIHLKLKLANREIKWESGIG